MSKGKEHPGMYWKEDHARKYTNNDSDTPQRGILGINPYVMLIIAMLLLAFVAGVLLGMGAGYHIGIWV